MRVMVREMARRANKVVRSLWRIGEKKREDDLVREE